MSLATSTKNRVIVWSVVLLAVLANAAGYFMNLYDRIAWFDEVLHVLTPFAVTLLLALWLYGGVLVGKGRHTALLIFTITLLGVGIGGLWEIGEWAFDHLSGPQSVIKGKTDTIIDLILDAGGALLAGWAASGMAQDRPV